MSYGVNKFGENGKKPSAMNRKVTQLLTTLTVVAGVAWRTRARVTLILKIFITCSAVYAVGISVALELCNIFIFQYYSIIIRAKYSLLG